MNWCVQSALLQLYTTLLLKQSSKIHQAFFLATFQNYTHCYSTHTTFFLSHFLVFVGFVDATDHQRTKITVKLWWNKSIYDFNSLLCKRPYLKLLFPTSSLTQNDFEWKGGKIEDTNVTKDMLGSILIRTYRARIIPEFAFEFLFTCNFVISRILLKKNQAN